MTDQAAELEKIFVEADTLIRLRLIEKGIEVPHAVVAVTADGHTVVRSNCESNMLFDIAQALRNIAQQQRQ